MAFLKRVGDEKRGRFKKMNAKLVPYVDEKGELIVPKPPPVSRKKMTRFHYMKVIKDEVDLPLSHDLAYFVAEHLEHLITGLAVIAEDNAKRMGHDRITSNHWYNFQLGPQQGVGYWPEHKEYAKDYKQYLAEEQLKPEDILDV
jgi:hypothetical protein